MPDTSKIIKYIEDPTRGDSQITKLVPLANLWDPGSAKESAYKQDLKKSSFISNIFMNNDKDNFSPAAFNWFPKRDSISDEYKIETNPDIKSKKPSIKLSFKNVDDTNSIYLDTGLSVLELSIIMNLVLLKSGSDNIPKVKDSDYNKYDVEQKQWEDKKKRINLVINGLNNYKIANSINNNDILLKILLDMKKQVIGVKLIGKRIYNYCITCKKALLISGDKLCALFSIFNNNRHFLRNKAYNRYYKTYRGLVVLDILGFDSVFTKG